MEYVAAIKAGRCFNGFHKDSGTVVHAVPPQNENTCSGKWYYKSACGTEPGLRSYGWTDTLREINCPKCLKKIQNEETIQIYKSRRKISQHKDTSYYYNQL